MILDAIYNGDFRPGETGFMDREDYREAMRAAELFRVQLMESIGQEDNLMLEQLVEYMRCAEAAACTVSFQRGFSAGLLLMQEAQALVWEQSV